MKKDYEQLQQSLDSLTLYYGISEISLLNFLSNDSKPDNTVVFVIDEYLTDLQLLVKREERSPETWKTYNNILVRTKEYILIHFPELKLNELNEIIISDIIHCKNSERKVAIRTVNKYHAVINSLLEFAYLNQLAKEDYRHKFSFKKTSSLPRYIKEEQIKEIFYTVRTFPKSNRCRAMIMFLLLTGCRVSEVSNLKVRDFNIEEDLIYIFDGKGKQDRIIPMFPQLKKEILRYLKKSGMPEWDPKCEGYLFARDEGTERKRNFPVRTIQHLVQRIRKRIPELSYMTVHSFRHTFANQCVKAGVKIHYITLLLGHTDPKTTMIYTKMHGEDLKAELNNKFPFRFEEILNAIWEED